MAETKSPKKLNWNKNAKERISIVVLFTKKAISNKFQKSHPNDIKMVGSYCTKTPLLPSMGDCGILIEEPCHHFHIKLELAHQPTGIPLDEENIIVNEGE